MARRRPRQLDLPIPLTWGGKRAGAGRKPNNARPGIWHVQRPAHDRAHPVLVTLRAGRQVPSLRSERIFATLRTALAAANRRDFRVLHFSVQVDHVHLVVEADAHKAFVRGIQGLAGRCAAAINRAAARRGAVWSDRYHARALRTPREMRAAIVYVLQNFRKHLRAPPVIDPRSSGPWFDGWAHEVEIPRAPSPIRPPCTWLASKGWKRSGGAVGLHEAPAASARP